MTNKKMAIIRWKKRSLWENKKMHGPYSPIFLQECALHLNVTQLLIGLTIWFSQSEVVLHSNLQNLGEKDKECS